jgi:hypothetical protein
MTHLNYFFNIFCVTSGRHKIEPCRKPVSASSLANIEKLVHISDPDTLRQAYVLIPVECHPALIKPLRDRLPKNWDSDSALPRLRALGDKWIASADSVGQRSDNILLNPAHPNFTRLKIGRPVGFDFDPRLDRG